MTTFADLVDKVEELSKEQVDELEKVVQLRWMELRRQEILEAAEEARKEHVEGKTVVLSTPEEIKSFFLKMIHDED